MNRKLIVWFGATVVSVAAGGFATYVFTVASPHAEITLISQTLNENAKFIDRRDDIEIPPKLRKLVQDSKWTTSRGFRKDHSPYDLFIASLNENLSDLKHAMQHISPLKGGELQAMRTTLLRGPNATRTERNEFFRKWESHDGFIGSICLIDVEKADSTLIVSPSGNTLRVATGSPNSLDINKNASGEMGFFHPDAFYDYV